MCEAQCEMPKYKCHKVVHALKIQSIEPSNSGGITITPEEEGFAPFHVDKQYDEKHVPRAGGYYVVYADGYRSFSPADVFEAGYKQV